MAKFTAFVNEMHTRTVKYPQKQPTRRKVWPFELGSVTKFSPHIHMPDYVAISQNGPFQSFHFSIKTKVCHRWTSSMPSITNFLFVCLEWSESKLGFSMLRNLLMQTLGAIGRPEWHFTAYCILRLMMTPQTNCKICLKLSGLHEFFGLCCVVWRWTTIGKMPQLWWSVQVVWSV